ncbi:PREDICTED: double-stranded RNA-binding protein 1-like isoform X2 [Lupinus angustifolius]|uniref:double-stranded RNA-binding protein 1-like isoform X2 n=1 Tax=Lupinus angustifolius TaxID=3871 RepID=UPI00092F3317|nr:PREDICTED: double-stranded RNA-binding protein 1-like isoform X2 [Lupinus angustifolius]
MYKTKVQQLCHTKSWNLPVYQTVKDGPDHNPHFISTVTVNVVQFQSPQPTRTAKQSQNDAAKLAFYHFSPNPDSNPNPNPNSHLSPSHHSLSHGSCDPCDVDSIVLQPTQSSQISSSVTSTMIEVEQKNILHLYKNQLQNYAHKRNLNLPVYASAWEGPPHALRFKCKVTIDGQTFESPKLFATLKDAENAAAEVALISLSPGGVQEGQIGLYKNLLQELVQRKGFRLPSYNTKKYGQAHMPIFVSQVEIEGETFTGQAAKSKKQAEMSAAKVAYMSLKERKGASAYQGQAPVLSTDSSEANVITGLQHHSNIQASVSPGLVATQGQPDKDIGVSTHQGQAPVLSTESSEADVITGLQHHAYLQSLVSSGLVTQHQPDKDIEKDTSKMSSTAINTPSRRENVVYSRSTNMNIEGGGTLMPISDENWVAYSYSH